MIAHLVTWYHKEKPLQQYSAELLGLILLFLMPASQWIGNQSHQIDPVFSVYWIVLVVSVIASSAVAFYFVGLARRTSLEVILSVVLVHLLPELTHNRELLQGDDLGHSPVECIVTEKWDSIKGCLSSTSFRTAAMVFDLFEIYTYLKHVKTCPLDQETRHKLQLMLDRVIEDSKLRFERMTVFQDFVRS